MLRLLQFALGVFVALPLAIVAVAELRLPPIVVLVGAAGALATHWHFMDRPHDRRERRRQRCEQGLCGECGYDLTGNVSGACPECGTAKA